VTDVPFAENAAFFFDGPVQDYRGAADWSGPEYSYRLGVADVSNSRKVIECLDSLALQPEASKLRALVIGKWCDYGECSNAAIIESLVNHRHSLSGLAAIFLGDITRKETRTAWIRNSDLSPLLWAYPNLEVLRARGGDGLRFSSRTSHLSLRDLKRCHLPNLVHLELWLGAKSGGWDGRLEDLEPLLNGSLFPALKYLGLRNSEIVDDIACAVVNTPLLQQLETLDLSNGNLSDRGGQALWGIKWDVPLRQLILNHHYMSPKVVQTLQMELRCKVIAEDAKCCNHEPRPIFAGA